MQQHVLMYTLWGINIKFRRPNPGTEKNLWRAQVPKPVRKRNIRANPRRRNGRLI
jgi:hypothetical protein